MKTVQIQFTVTFKILRTNNDTEYVNEILKSFLVEQNIEFQNYPPREYESDKVAERPNRIIVTKTQTILQDLATSLWAEAIATTVYLYNYLHHSSNQSRASNESLHEIPLSSSTHLPIFD